MNRKSKNYLCVLVLGAMLLVVFTPVNFVGAGPGQEHNIYGLDAQGGTSVGTASSIPGGSEITGWIDGVQYGLNTSVGSQYDLYVKGDDWGVPVDDVVKDGGYDGDTLMYFLDYDPQTTYHFQISETTSTFGEGTYEQFDNLFFDTQTDTDPNYSGAGGTYLRGLKINELVLAPFPYLFIEDPGGEMTEAYLEDANHGYYLEKDDSTGHTTSGPIFEFSANPSDVVQWSGPNSYFINLSGWSISTDDELKLVWKNPVNWGGTATAHNIANGTDVIVDRIEWGNFANQHAGDYSWRDHDNTTLLDAPAVPGAGQSIIRANVIPYDANGTDTDDCSADFILTGSPTPPYVPPPVTGMPGAPSNLEVHKGGGAWGGAAGDLVLTWDAPSIDYVNLVSNIVYYDTDLSNGFQYTTFMVFPTTDPGAGNMDQAVMVGFLADANEYAFIVHTTGDAFQGGPNENMTNSNVGYKYNQVLDGSMDWIWISIPYVSDYDWLSDVTDDGFSDDTTISTVQRWDYTTQTYEKRSYIFGAWVGDFDILPGDALLVFATTGVSYTWKIVGAHDDSLQFTLDDNPTLTDFLMISLPFHRTYQMASDISAEFPDGSDIDIISRYDYTVQNWDSWFYSLILGWTGVNFNVYASPADVILFKVTSPTPVSWQPQVMIL